MTHATYSSLEAFLTHHRALKAHGTAGADERKLLASMEQALGMLRPEERLALESDSADSATARHRERARLGLGRELRARGMLEG